jgi:molybdate transport system ATP-binding protein
VVAGLAAALDIRRGNFRLDLDLEVGEGEVVALLGPNGAGKSTALRALAGLVRLDGGRIVLDGATLANAETREHLPAHRRPIGVVFQEYLLFPHLSVLDNVAFGLRTRGRPVAIARQMAAGWLERIGITEVASARPRAISGGQAQRVALARALAVQPRLLLLDEPLAALDARTRLLVRGELRRHLAEFGGATLVVTHDPVDAAVLADRLVVVEHGQVVQQGSPREVARRPRTDYVARLVGLNLLAGVAEGHQVVLPTGGVVHVAESVAGTVKAAFRPSAVSLFTNRPDGSPRNVWLGRILAVEPHGEGVRIDVGGAPDAASSILAEVTPGAVADLGLQPGSTVWASVKALDVEVYPADPGPAGSGLPVA